MEIAATQVTGKNEAMAASILTDFLGQEEFARQLGTSLRTVRRWDSLRIGPPKVVIGRKIFYRREAVQDWLRSREDGGARNGRRGTRRGSR
jgi:hypothetical protein